MEDKFNKFILNVFYICIGISYISLCLHFPAFLDSLFNTHCFNNGLMIILSFIGFGIIYFIAYEILENQKKEQKKYKEFYDKNKE